MDISHLNPPYHALICWLGYKIVPLRYEYGYGATGTNLGCIGGADALLGSAEAGLALCLLLLLKAVQLLMAVKHLGGREGGTFLVVRMIVGTATRMKMFINVTYSLSIHAEP